jgi:hypothetical protein
MKQVAIWREERQQTTNARHRSNLVERCYRIRINRLQHYWARSAGGYTMKCFVIMGVRLDRRRKIPLTLDCCFTYQIRVFSRSNFSFTSRCTITSSFPFFFPYTYNLNTLVTQAIYTFCARCQNRLTTCPNLHLAHRLIPWMLSYHRPSPTNRRDFSPQALLQNNRTLPPTPLSPYNSSPRPIPRRPPQCSNP